MFPLRCTIVASEIQVQFTKCTSVIYVYFSSYLLYVRCGGVQSSLTLSLPRSAEWSYLWRPVIVRSAYVADWNFCSSLFPWYLVHNIVVSCRILYSFSSTGNISAQIPLASVRNNRFCQEFYIALTWASATEILDFNSWLRIYYSSIGSQVVSWLSFLPRKIPHPLTLHPTIPFISLCNPWRPCSRLVGVSISLIWSLNLPLTVSLIQFSLYSIHV